MHPPANLPGWQRRCRDIERSSPLPPRAVRPPVGASRPWRRESSSSQRLRDTRPHYQLSACRLGSGSSASGWTSSRLIPSRTRTRTVISSLDVLPSRPWRSGAICPPARRIPEPGQSGLRRGRFDGGQHFAAPSESQRYSRPIRCLVPRQHQWPRHPPASIVISPARSWPHRDPSHR